MKTDHRHRHPTPVSDRVALWAFGAIAVAALVILLVIWR